MNVPFHRPGPLLPPRYRQSWLLHRLGHPNAVAESFFQLLKQERIKRKIYITWQEESSDVFDTLRSSTARNAAMVQLYRQSLVTRAAFCRNRSK